MEGLSQALTNCRWLNQLLHMVVGIIPFSEMYTSL